LQSKIYALCDFELLKSYKLSLSDYIKRIENLDLIYIQYRDKVNDFTTQEKNIKSLKQISEIPIIINDNLELLKYADGIHLGQEDLQKLSKRYKLEPIKMIQFIRKKYQNKIIGISTHNELEILEANKFNIDYIGLGAYRDTSTKQISNILGDNISYLAKISIHPVGAIGGVKLDDDIKNISYKVIGSDLLKDKRIYD
jgi:thiamine-phosphate pyrophosphorylase